MDAVLSDTLKANLKSAKDTPGKIDALVLAMIAVVDCQCKTSGRVKFLRTAFFALAGAILILVVAGPDALREIIKLCKGG